MLKIYSSKKWLLPTKPHNIMLYPFWGEARVDKNDPDFGRFDDYCSLGKKYFELVENIEYCDIAIYPCDLNPGKESIIHLKSIAAETKAKNKKLLVFYNADDDKDYEVENVILFRTSFYKSLHEKNVYAFPGWSLDFKNYFPSNELFYLEKKIKPMVSYCGYIDYTTRTLSQHIKAFIKPKKDNESQAKKLRGNACRKIMNNKKIETNFIIRNGFWAGDIADKNTARKEYANNMINSTYALVARGGGNFSYRLYEVLSCGRIPVFINTDCMLPFDSTIDWKKHVVWVEENELNKIDEKIVSFHIEKSNEELKNIQISNRELYENFISPIGFYKTLSLFLKEIASH